jgi:4-hydroxy-tetrahydrodipicolinate synthase
MAQLCSKALSGDRAGAELLNERLTPLNKALFLEANPIPVKWAMQQRALIKRGIRLPLTPLDPRYHDEVLSAMEAAGI